MFESRLPEGSLAVRDALFDGTTFLLRGSDASHALVRDAWARIEDSFADVGGAGRAQFELSGEAFFERVKVLRREFFCAPEWHQAMARIVEARGFDVDGLRFDPMRLRVVMSGGHRNEAAAPVYATHRDTWYGHPPGLVTWWVALHETEERESFVFYPEVYGEPVENDSETFDYREWVKDGPDLKIGWQHVTAGRTASFPAWTGGTEASSVTSETGETETSRQALGPEIGFGAHAGDELLFAGAHLHRTLGHDSERTRFSFDFRFVALDDLESGRGAPRVDDRSRGAAEVDYLRVFGG